MGAAGWLDVAKDPWLRVRLSSPYLQGHTLLARLSGSVAASLSSTLAQHVPATSSSTSSALPLSTTSQTPKAALPLAERLIALMQRAPIMVFMKGNPDSPKCGFSRTTVGLLRSEGVQFGWFDILSDNEVREGLKKHNDWPSECS